MYQIVFFKELEYVYTIRKSEYITILKVSFWSNSFHMHSISIFDSKDEFSTHIYSLVICCPLKIKFLVTT